MVAVSTPQKPLLQRNWVTYGLVGGGVAVGITILLYLIDVSFLYNQLLTTIPFVVALVISILAAVKKRQDQGGYIMYGQAVATSLGAIVIATVIYSLFYIILFLLIDDSLLPAFNNAVLQNSQNLVDKGWMTKDQYDATETLLHDNPKSIFLYTAIQGIVVFCVFGLIVFLISSIFIRREPQR
jgi:hypothetical protein